MIAGQKTANAIGGRTARACESCLRRRARWYCAADDAFLCGGCDASIHSANQLARRHERVRLETAPPPLASTNTSSKPDGCSSGNPPSNHDSVSVPAWHGGFTRKARTPRKKSPGADGGAAVMKPVSAGDLVPELSSEFDASTASRDESDDGLQCVPVFDPLLAVDDCDLMGVGGGDISGTCAELDFGLLLPSEMDLEEFDFAADMESLLGKVEMDEETGDGVKVKDELLGEDIMLQLGDDGRSFEGAGAWEVAEASVDWDLEFKLPAVVAPAGGQEVEEEKPAAAANDEKNVNTSISNNEQRRKMLLRLNYDDVITAWASHGSPWTEGTRPDFRSDDVWLDCKGSYASDVHNQHMNYGDAIGLRVGGDVKAREARVSRYREKRRTRMFSKKIRYQVRKLNAEKRPRMKGRFVKRTPSGFAYQG